MTITYLGNLQTEHIFNSGKSIVLDETEIQELGDVYEFEEEIKDLESQVFELEAELNDLQDKIFELEDTIDKKEFENDMLKIQNGKFRADIKELCDLYSNITTSKSKIEEIFQKYNNMK